MNEALRWLLLPWWWMQRRADVKMLWPICRDMAQNRDDAHEAFMAHAMMSPCWIGYYGERRLIEVVRAME